MNNKLMFVLCQSCGQKMSIEDCQHNENERALTGTWVIDEVLKALEKGYKIIEIFKIWKYKIEQYDKQKMEGGLFTSMMNKFLKIKQEASDWPRDCQTEAEKIEYIENFLKREGIKLEFQNIQKNPGLRCLAKLILNSFWGKFGQLERKPKTKIVNNEAEYVDIMSNPLYEISGITIVNEDVVVMNYIEIEEAYEPLLTVNVAIAAYTTAQARLKLYEYLDQLGERVLYYDTDSVIYVDKPGVYNPPVGQCIGDMTDELEAYGRGSYIKEFVSGGPKNYAYLYHSTDKNEDKVECKVKGFKLNYSVSQKINFEAIKNMVLGISKDNIIEIEQTAIRRTKEHNVVTKEETKKYRLNSTKRIFLDNYDSVPYGYKKKIKLNILPGNEK